MKILLLRAAALVVPVATISLVACSSDGGGDGSSGSSTSGGSSSGASSGGSSSGASSGGSSSGGSSGGSSSGGSSSGQSSGGPITTMPPLYGSPHDGVYNFGPVDFAETEWHNSCAPYPKEIQAMYGEYIAGLAMGWNGNGQLCDACIVMTSKQTGKSMLLRVVTTGTTVGPNDVDLSPKAYAEINAGEEPRKMTWQLAQCPDTTPLHYQFQTEAHTDWTSFWVRNPRVPVTKVEVQSAKHAGFAALRRETDGTINDDGGFGPGAFTLKLTGMDGQVVTESFPGFSPGQLLKATQQFK